LNISVILGIFIEQRVTALAMELILARKFDPVSLKYDFKFFFIKQGSLYDPVPDY
jgi:hypothetical protein